MSLFNRYSQNIDPLTGSLVTIDTKHDQVHRGNLFISSGITSIASLGTSHILFKVPSNAYPHFQGFTLDTDTGPVTITWYESPTITANGTPINSVNSNRNSLNVAATLLYSSPTVILEGNLLLTKFIPAGKQEGGEGVTNSIEWILKPNTNYLAKIYNGSNQTANVNYYTKWYEVK